MTSAGAASASEPETASSFFYGTLMAPEVFFTVCYRLGRPPAALIKQHPFQDAMLHGYTRHRVQGQDYPGIIEDSTEGACVRGMLAEGITETNMHRLDVFEGREYERRTVDVDIEVEGVKKTVKAQVYVYKKPDRLERREWDFEEFRREKMHKWARADLTFEGEQPQETFRQRDDRRTGNQRSSKPQKSKKPQPGCIVC
ncbi:disease resistance protein [Ophiostoma piceae UAMH 11346]|uniref:Putative gamma-glutamylcyclotransferase n=1 Tax=Ophiostoma piceae (strain UAMH 11346) TaxID=1262450 RepID=S3CFB9_OPHP1|nr:disease resistance protein [Ophiostoma piceae UAMH 11346]